MDKTDQNQSVPDLLNQLVGHYSKRCFLKNDNPKVRQLIFSSLKKKVYNTLFETINGPLKRTPGRLEKQTSRGVRQRVLQIVFEQRMCRKFDPADRLEKLSSALLDGGESEMVDVFHFLFCLADTNHENVVPLIGKMISLPELSGDIYLPQGPLNYGDTRHVSHKDLHFTQFPKETFDSLSRPLSSQDITDSERYLMETVSALPGSGIYSMLQGSPRMRNSFSMGPGLSSSSSNLGYALPSSLSDNCLMGALSQPGQKTRGSSFVRLDLPDLYEHGPVPFRPRLFASSIRQSNEASEDEGFNESSLAPSCSMTHGFSSIYVDPLYSALEDLENPRPVKFTWECRGLWEDSESESGYLSEASSLAAECALALKRHQLSTLRPGTEVSRVLVPNLSEDGDRGGQRFPQQEYRQVINDVLNLLIGLQSDTYTFDSVAYRFRVNSVAGGGGFLVRSGAELALRAGSNFARLRTLVTLDWQDPVMRAFSAALHAHLNAYRACIVALNQRKPKISFLEVSRQVRGLTEQLEHLVHLCNLSLENEDFDFKTSLPHGIELLAYLFQRTQDYSGGSHLGVLMLALFREACRPFVQFLHDWTFTGVCRGGSDSFLILSNEAFLHSKDKKYWVQAYELRGLRCYLLPETLMTDVFRCGKSLNLLRRVAPKHFLFFSPSLAPPPLALTLSPRATEWQLMAVEAHVSRMREMSWQRRATRQQLHLREQLAKKELLRLAREANSDRLERLKKQQLDARMKEDARKRIELEQLRKEAEKAKERRKKEEEERKRAPEEVEEVSDAAREMERRARDELVAYYSKLTADAAFRELRAMWRMQRKKLDGKRREFLMRDEAKWRQAMEVRRESLSPRVSILSVADPSLSFLRHSVLENSVMDTNNSAIEFATSPRERWADRSGPEEVRGRWADRSGPEEVRGRRADRSGPEEVHVPQKPKRKTWARASAVSFQDLPQESAKPVTSHDEMKSLLYPGCPPSPTPPSNEISAVLEDGKAESGEPGKQTEVTGGESKPDVGQQEVRVPKKRATWRPALEETDWAVEEEHEQRRLDRFRERNQHGHSSQSTVQRLLYGSRYGMGLEELEESVDESGEGRDWTLLSGNYLEPYAMEMEELDRRPFPQLMRRREEMERSQPMEEANTEEEEEGSLLPLPVIMRKALVKPLVAQIRLVNEVVINHFVVDLRIQDYFTSLRHYFMMEDGEFGDSLCQLLFPKIQNREKIANISFLNQVLSTAVQQSQFSNSVLADKLSFCLKSGQSETEPSLDLLGLTCTVEWPMNIIITENSMSKYNKIFSYLLQMKHAVWAVADVHFKLRRDALVHPNLHTSEQMRRLHLFRHDMEHLLKVLEVYMCQQVSQVTWDELVKDLNNRCHHLDDLRRVHAEYLNRGLHRCLLTPKLKPVMRVVLAAFQHVHRFRRLLLVHPWETSGRHPNFDRLVSTHTAFKEHMLFLHRVMSKLVRRGARQKHLEQFLLLLDFNRYYSAAV